MEEVVKCSACKKNLNLNNFSNKSSGEIYKCCSSCIDKMLVRRNNNKCPCGNQIHHCKVCNGSSFCIHDKQRSQCKVCNDPIKVTITNMIASTKQSDKKYNRFDADHFIDRDFLNGLINDQKYCYWPECGIKLQYVTYANDLATIERLNNSIGHIKNNCVLACMHCNKLKKSNKK